MPIQDGRPSLPRRPGRPLAAALAVLAGLLVGGHASAQSGIAVDGTLPGTVAGDVLGPDYAITPDLGFRIGNTQLYSFDRFGLAFGERATFSGPVGITQVVSRVTGSQPSSIDGVLRSTIAGADFYFVNPNGVVFGQNAQLDVAGSFVATTADYLALGDDGIFHASDPAADVLTASPVSAFGFVAERPAGITVLGRLESTFADSQARVGNSLSLIGGDIEIRGVPGELTYLYSRGGRIDLASIGSPGIVRIVDAPGVEPDLVIEAEGERGDVRISGGGIVASGGPPPNLPVCLNFSGCRIANGSGDIFVRARDLEIEDGEIRATTVTDRDGGDIDVGLTGVLRARSLQQLETSGIATRSGLEAELGPGPGVDTVTDVFLLPEGLYTVEVEVLDGLEFINNLCATGTCVAVRYNGTGRAGDIRVKAESVELRDGARLSSSGRLGGDGGNIFVDTNGAVSVVGTQAGSAAGILANARGAGNGGSITIDASDLFLDDQGIVLSEVRGGTGSGGAITIDVGRLRVTGEGRIDTSTRGSGQGGQISVTATESVLLSGGSSPDAFSGISTISQMEGTGDAGGILIDAPRIDMMDGAAVTTDARGPGNAGVIDVRTDELRMRGSRIASAAEAGEGGGIFVNGGPLTRNPDGSIGIATPPGVGSGFRLEMIDSEITTSVAGGPGGGGDVAIDTQFVVLLRSRILAQAVDGPGGNIRIVADTFIADSTSQVDASSRNSTDGVVDLPTPAADLRGERPELPDQIPDVSSLLRERCAARTPGTSSSFVVSGRDGLPPSPEGYLPAPTPRVVHSGGEARAGQVVVREAGEPVALVLGCRV